jgi:hypothetical protein
MPVAAAKLYFLRGVRVYFETQKVITAMNINYKLIILNM